MALDNISKFNKCSNCGACLNICPVNAIKIDSSSLFYKYFVDDNICIKCGKCVKVCPLENPKKIQNISQAIGGWNKKTDVISKSSSGGIFSILADYIISQGGVVFGARYSGDYHSVYIDCSKNIDINSLRKSKYVESNVGYTFRMVKELLSTGKKVLYCGAPCQVAGLRMFLNKEYENLYICDFACGGMPSHKLYEKYICELENKYKSSICNVDFRSKIFGWSIHSIRCSFKNGKQYNQYGFLDPYFYSFVYKKASVREECLNCYFSDNHHSDLILADFWKYSSLSKLRNSDLGISLVLSNSPKGDKLMEYLKENIIYEDLDINKASYNCVSKSAQLDNNERNKFLDIAINSDIKSAALSIGLLTGIKSFLWTFRRKIGCCFRKIQNGK